MNVDLTHSTKNTDIEVDGGVGPTTIDKCCSAGANMIVSGTAVTQSPDPEAVIIKMREIGEQSRMI